MVALFKSNPPLFMRLNNIRLRFPRSAKELLSSERAVAIVSANPFSADNMDKRTRRRYIRFGIIGGNIVLVLGIGWFVLINRSASQTIRSGTVSSVITTTGSLFNPLDQLSSEQIALQAAQMTNLPELLIVKNRADSATALLASIPNDSTILAKPQVVSTAQKSKADIIHYISQPSDTITGLSLKFGVSTNSIKWSNGLTTDLITPNTALVIPPGDGIVYTVKAGDTPTSLTTKYQSNKETFITVNDAESGSLSVGELVWVPNGIQPAPVFSFAAYSGLPGTGAHRFGSCGLGVNNGYFCGWCTWWTAYRRAQVGNPVPSNLGDAYTWRLGLTHDVQGPHAGDVIWFPFNHVGFVEKIDDNGDVEMSEMNHQGWDVVDYRIIPAAQAGSYTYLL